MQKLGLNEIREKYLDFFQSKGHYRLGSYSLVPQNDKSLLLINSGMAPMKAYFTGQEVPPSKRVTTCQKCIRTGDIENVGQTARHGTFFEMLGNFSFGDYFKEEVIPWAWEFLTKELEIPTDRLYVSVYEEDDEAREIWNKKVGIPYDRIFKMGKDDNFWEVGLGPCGPCSEIYYDKGEKYGCGEPGCTVGCDCDRYMEVWNLVFTQFEKLEDGSYVNLANPNIDTGMGLERIATVMQDVNSLFDVDTIKTLRDKVCEIVNRTYGKEHKDDVKIRIITDHIRSVTFMTSDGVLPSNEGRGYVLRRLLRRAIMQAKLLGVDRKIVEELANVVIDSSKGAYTELEEKKEYILKVLSVEEARFFETLNQGMELVNTHIEKIKNDKDSFGGTLVGKEAFRLYDTFGFPLELLKEMLLEHSITIDEKEFYAEMEQQKERARAARTENTYMGSDETVFDKLPQSNPTAFTGYNNITEENCKIEFIIKDDELVQTANQGDKVVVILDKTSFYAESGGQKGEVGRIETANAVMEVLDVKKISGNRFVHTVEVIEDSFSVGDIARTIVDAKNRKASARNHTSAHLLQKALKDVLGNHIEQAGSSVDSNRCRFDFTHFSALSSMEIKHVERLVNEKILECLEVSTKELPIEEAKKQGAIALFGEKYGDTVRVVEADGYSVELCGGIHVNNTSEICAFKIVSETGVAAGVRRIEAMTGQKLFDYFRELDESNAILQNLLKATPGNVIKKVESYVTRTQELNKELEKLKEKANGNIIDDLIATKDIVNNANLIAAFVENTDANGLITISDKIKEKVDNAVTFLVTERDDKVSVTCMVSDEVQKLGGNAGKIIAETCAILGGKGGGRPNMAQGSGTDASKIADALIKAKEVLKEQLK